MTETLNIKLSGGYYFTTLDYTTQALKFVPPGFYRLVNLPATKQSGNFAFGADLKKEWSEKFSTTLSAGEQQYNDVNTRSFDSTFFSVTANYKLSELTTFNFVARYNMNNQISQGIEKIDYYILNPSIERNLTENLIVRLAGSYEHESDQDFMGAAGAKLNYDRFRTWVNLTYKWPRYFASH